MIGTGAFSTSLALLLALKEENEIVMWSENKKLVSDYKKTHKIESLYKDRMFPKNIMLTNRFVEVAQDIDVLFLVTGVFYLENVCKEISPFLNRNIPVVIGTKGIADTNHGFAFKLVESYLKNPISVLGGPTFSVDVSNYEPIGFQLACKRKKHFLLIQGLFDSTKVKMEHSYDRIGVSLCGCLKNAYAIGAGILSGLGYHESTHALYLTSVYLELESILGMYDASIVTLHGFAGFGDLVLTCSSTTSRNFTYGEYIGKKEKKMANRFLKETTVEGVSTLQALLPLLLKKHIKSPLLSCISEILEFKKDPDALVEELMKEKKTSKFTLS